MSPLVVLLACATGVAPERAAWRDRLPPPGEDPALAAAGVGGATASASHAADDSVLLRPPTEVVRFVALGDAGMGDRNQFAVADAVERVCASVGCDFAIQLGDNIYNSGVDSAEDVQFDEKFEIPYANIDFPFYPSLGNHDYGGSGSGYEFWKWEYYIDYSDRSDKWTFPARYYRVDAGVVELYALDTNAIVWGMLEDQVAWLDDRVPRSTASWKIAYGHHPYLSNGSHGNAGVYDGRQGDGKDPIGDGAYVKEAIDAAVCGKIDLYLCGHDHNLQWLAETCEGTEFVVSGAAGKWSSLHGDNDVWFEEGTLGFLWVEVSQDSLTGVFYDDRGDELFRRTLEH
jgi:tartrate-resistant acid phosphatase type 5